jgi:CheY-like chemotaxis protein
VRHTILIVEDNQEMRAALAELLDMEGYKVLTAEHGGQALQQLRESDHLPDLVLLDLQMPVMSGEEFIEALPDAGIAGTNDMTIIAVTASRLHLDSVTDVLRKPFELDELLDKVKQHLN